MENIKECLIEFINNPYNDIINFNLAVAYEEEKQYASAFSYYLRSAEFTDNNILASESLVRCSLCLNKQEERDQKELYFIKHAITASPNSIEPYYIASLYFSWRSGNIPEKRNWLDSYMYANMAINLIENNLECKEKFRIPIDFDVYNLYYQKGYAGMNIGKINEARDIFIKILQELEASDNRRDYIIIKLNELPEPNHPIISYSKKEDDESINKEKYMLSESKIMEDPVGLSVLIEEQRDKENDMLIKSKYFKVSYQIITFGTDYLYKNQKIRFKKQATDIDFFDNIIIEDEKTIKPLLKEHENFIINNKKGYGYWIWKPIIIKNQLEKMSENDILFYLDCGSSIIDNNDKLNEYINILKDKEIIVFENADYKIKRYIKTNLINEFNITDDILETYQIDGGCIILKNSKRTKEFIDEWIKYMIKDNYQLLNDDLLNLSQNEQFIEHRHDQSILTVLARQKDYIYINNSLEELYNNGPFLHTRLIDMGARQWPGMRLINNLNNFPKVLILTIPENKSRQQTLINDCKRYNLNYEIFECQKYPDCKSKYICNYKFPDSNHHIGVTCGYIKMLKYWYDNYNEDYAFFCEDDIDFTISDKWKFTWDDFMNELGSKWSIVQTVIISQNPENIDFNLSKKETNEWSITGNLIKRDYCKYLLDQYYIDHTNYNLSLPDYENIIPLVPEDLIYRPHFLYNSNFYYPLSKPLFTENNKFQIQTRDIEDRYIHINSNNYINNYIKSYY